MVFVERENEILESIRLLLEKDFDLIVVGGYAVSGLAKHRFSVDCDVVILKRDLEKIQTVLEKFGFKSQIEKDGFDPIYGGQFVRMIKDIHNLPIKIDLLIDSLVCRNTNASWSYEFIKGHSVIALIPGIESSIRCRTPKRELLIAFKIHSARKTDIRDIIMLNENVDPPTILQYLRRGDKDLLINQIKKIKNTLSDQNLINSLKGVFKIATDVKKEIDITKQLINSLLEEIYANNNVNKA